MGELVQRTRDRRISDDDYVDRYFALTLPSNELTDATINAVVRDWSDIALSATASEAFIKALAAQTDSPAAYAQADSTVRRAAAKSTELDADASAALVSSIVSVLPKVCMPTRRLVVEWLAETVLRSRPIAAETLLARLETDIRRESMLFFVLQAFERAATTRSTMASSGSWVVDVTRKLARAGLDRYFEQMQLGDEAPSEAAFGYLLYAERSLGAEGVRTELQALVDEGKVRVADLAARFVSIGQYTESFREFITDFNPDDVGSRIGWDRIEAAEQELIEALGKELPGAERNSKDYDISWGNRRLHATRGLLSRLRSAQSAQLSPVDEVDEATRNAIINRGGDVLNATQADLEFTATLFAPLDALSPSASHENLDDIAPQWLESLEQHQLANTLRESTASWHAEASNWRIIDSDGRRFQHATMALTPKSPDEESQFSRSSVVIAGVWAEMLPEVSNPSGKLSRVVSVGVGFWLGGLDDERQATQTQTTTRPLPAALQLGEAWRWAATVVRAALLADYRLIGVMDSSSVVLNLAGRTNRGLDAVLDLRDFRRDTDRAMSESSVAVFTPIADRERAHQREPVADPDRLVAQLFRKWLQGCGYRQFENAMAAASGRFTHQLERDGS